MSIINTLFYRIYVLRIKVFLLIVLFTTNYCTSQPIHTSAVIVDNVFCESKSYTFLKSPNSNNYKESQTRIKYSYIGISINTTTSFIFKKDTMSIIVLFDKYSPYKFEIKRLNFQKGNFIFDLRRYMEKLNKKTYPIVIESLPCDSLESKTMEYKD